MFVLSRLLGTSTVVVVIASHAIIARRRYLAARPLLLSRHLQVRVYQQLLLNLDMCR